VDALTEVLHDLRLSGSSYCRTELSSPWGLEIPAHDAASFHVIVSGCAWLRAGGEPILLELTFTARVPGYQINEITTEPASPVDQVLLSPAKGVYCWLDDYSRQGRYSPDYSTSNELQPGQPVTIKLPLNALYRFDEAGRYSVHVVTSRTSSGDFLHAKPAGPLASNDVSFDIAPMDDTDESAEAEHLESLIRSARDLRGRRPAT